MLQPVRACLGNLPVGYKLLLSFGLVSALSMGAIAMAFHAADTLLASHRQSQQMAELQLLLLQAHAAEKDYALTSALTPAQQVQEAMTRLSQQVLELQPTVDSHLLGSLAEIDRGSRDYRTQFDQFVQQTQTAEQALAAMQQQADQARIQFEFVELDMYGALREAVSAQGQVDAQILTFAENASSLIRLLLAARVQEFAYIQGGDMKHFATWDDLLQGAEGHVALLLTNIGEEYKETLSTAQQAVIDYRQAFEHYRKTRLANELCAQEMQRLAAAVLQQADLALAEHQRGVEAQAAAIMRVLSLSALAILVMAISAGLVIRQLILPPLQRALGLARDIADGDLSRDIADSRRDELGQLCQVMGRMSSSLRGLVLRIVEGIAELRLAAEQLQQTSQQNSAGALRQQDETGRAAAATQQMACSAEAVARHAEQASLATQQAKQQVGAGEHVVRQGAEQISRLALDIEASMQTIEQLHQGSERIGGVLDVIKAVAEQTNLLALNAAIEAARAGGQGRGFAVVADEVRALAQRTQLSAREIEALIAQLQGLSQLAVQQMAGSARLSQEAVAYSGQARDALTQITGAVKRIEQLNGQIAATAEEQNAVAGAISQNVEQVRSVAEQGAIASDHVARSSAVLARLGSELQQLVQQFRT